MESFEELVLELTDWCPLSCVHCSSNSGPWCKNRLGKGTVRRLISEAAELGASKVSLGGGEPTASPLFCMAIDAITSQGMRAEVFTCGVQRSDACPSPLRDDVIRAASGVGLVTFIFSIHGASPATHDAITQVSGSFDCLHESLAACQRAGVHCQLNFVPLKVNRYDFAQVVERAAHLDIDRVSVLRFVPQGRGRTNQWAIGLSHEEEREFVVELLSLRAASEVGIRTGSPFNGIIPRNHIPCRAGAGKLVVQADGNVLPCEVFKHARRCDWGLSIHTQGLGDVLSAPCLNQLRSSLESSACQACPVHAAIRERLSLGVANGIPEDPVQAIG